MGVFVLAWVLEQWVSLFFVVLEQWVSLFLFVLGCGELLAPVVLTVPMQLLAYHVAVLRGTDVDQPSNLAKSVTVE